MYLLVSLDFVAVVSGVCRVSCVVCRVVFERRGNYDVSKVIWDQNGHSRDIIICSQKDVPRIRMGPIHAPPHTHHLLSTTLLPNIGILWRMVLRRTPTTILYTSFIAMGHDRC